MCRCPANTPPLARLVLLQFGARRRFEPNRAPSKFCSPDFWSRSECTLRNATAIWRKFCEHSDSRAHPEAKACARTVFSTASRRYGKIRQQSRARSLRTADPKTQCKGFWKIKLLCSRKFATDLAYQEESKSQAFLSFQKASNSNFIGFLETSFIHTKVLLYTVMDKTMTVNMLCTYIKMQKLPILICFTSIKIL